MTIKMMREEGDRGRPREEGGHTPLKLSLDAEIMAALAKVKKKQPISQFVEDVIRPYARQFDPGPSSPVAMKILNSIKAERDKSLEVDDIERVVALDYLLLRIKPVLDPFIAMSEPEGTQQLDTIGGGDNNGSTETSMQVPPTTNSMFSEESTKVTLGRLYYALDYLIAEFESVFSQSKNIIDLKVVKAIRSKYVDIETALLAAGLISDEFDFRSRQQFVHEVTERKDMISRVLSKKFPRWSKEVKRPPDARPANLWLPDYLLLIKVDPTTEHYRANVVAKMSPQFAELERNLSSAKELTSKLTGRYPELGNVLQLLQTYEAFFAPGFKKCKEYEERDRRLMQSVRKQLANCSSQGR